MCLETCPRDFGPRLRAARIAARLSLSDAAAALGVDARTVDAWERRWRRPTAEERRQAEGWIQRVAKKQRRPRKSV